LHGKRNESRDTARAMSEENVDLFREYIERFNGGDVEGALRYAHPEIRFEHRLAELQADVTGIDAARDWFVGAIQIFDRWRIDCDDIRDLGDRVLALGTVRAVGKASGVEVEMPYTVVATFRNGLVTRFTDYGDREAALKAAGLSE
jgi:ketosteroid isomerase-like protein